MRWSVATVCALASVVLAACAESPDATGDPVAPLADAGADASEPAIDASTPADVECAAPALLRALGQVGDGLGTLDFADGFAPPLRIDYNGRFGETSMLRLALFENVGAFAEGFAPGTYTLAGDDIDVSTCGLCVLLFARFFEPEVQYFIARSGTVAIDRLDASPNGSLVATATDLELTRYSFDGQQQTLFEDCTTRIDSVEFDVTLEAPPHVPAP